MLSLERASYRHAGASAASLFEVTLELADGTVTGLLGPGESGLSTLCLVLGGLAPRVVRGNLDGRLRIDGSDVTDWPMHLLAERVATGLGQPAAQLSMLAETVFEEVAFGPTNLGLPRDEVIGRAWRALERMAIVGLATRDPRHLSGGEQQLVVLASLLAMGTRHLVLDAPLAQLDQGARERVSAVLRAEAQQGRALLVADHRADALRGRCDRVLHLSDGRVVDGAPALRLPAIAAAQPPRIETPAPDIVLEVVSHRYASGVTALDGIDLVVRGGEAVAIVGPNGSGKTTLARHLDGLLRPTRGRVLIGGEDAAARSVAELARTVALGFQDPDRQVFARSVAAEVAFGPRHLGRDQSTLARSVESALAVVGLEHAAEAHPGDLGASRRKLLAIASLLAMECPVLVLDEPTAGLDEAGLAVVTRIVEAQRTVGRTVIAISHDERFVAEAFQRVVRLESGRVVGDGPPPTVRVRG